MIRVRLVGLSIAVAVVTGAMVAAPAGAQTRESAADSQQSAGITGALMPANVQTGAVLVPVVRQLLDDSPTFRAQCARVAAARFLRIWIEPVLRPRSIQAAAARTTMRRYDNGMLLAIMEIPAPLTVDEYAELLGHEFEHVLEQVDGVDLDALADAGAGATLLGDGAFETQRARRAGRAVLAEVEQPAGSDPVVRALGRVSKALKDAAGAPERRSIGAR